MRIDQKIAPDQTARPEAPAPDGDMYPPARVALWRRIVATGIRALIPGAILFVGWTFSGLIMDTAPEAGRKPPTRDARLVEVAPVEAATRAPVIEAWGVVEPAIQAVIRPEITGRVVAMHPELAAGGRIVAGAELLQLDGEGYRLDLARAETELDRVNADIAIERGNQEVARREYRLLGRKLSPEEEALILRQPQLARLEANRAAAIAAIDAARLDVSRASIPAPFDAIILSENVDIGAALTPSSEIATLVGSDVFHVTIALPPGALAWVEVPRPGERGAEVRLFDETAWGPGVYRTGYVVRLSPALTDQGRMTEVVVALEDPLALETQGAPRVLLGSFIRAELIGRPIPEAVRIARSSLRDGNTVWVMTEENTLEIRDVTVAWRDADQALVIDGLLPGDKVVTSQLATVADGMALRIRDPETPGAGEEGAGPARQGRGEGRGQQ